MLRLALSTLVLTLGLPIAALALPGDPLDRFVFDENPRRVVIGFDQPQNLLAGPLAVETGLVNALNPFTDAPPAGAGPTGCLSAPGSANIAPTYTAGVPLDPITGLHTPDAPYNVVTSGGRPACRSVHVRGMNLDEPEAGGGAGAIGAGFAAAVPLGINKAGVVPPVPFSLRVNRLLSGEYIPDPLSDSWQIRINGGAYRQFIDNTSISIQTIWGGGSNTTHYPWSDLTINFDAGTGNTIVRARGTVRISLGDLGFLSLQSTLPMAFDFNTLIADLPGKELPPALQGIAGVLPGTQPGTQYTDILGTPLEFACMFDVPGGVVAFASAGPTVACREIPGGVLADIADRFNPAQINRTINATGFAFAGGLPTVSGVGDMAFWEIPEPNSMLLLGAALAGLAALRRARSE